MYKKLAICNDCGWEAFAETYNPHEADELNKKHLKLVHKHAKLGHRIKNTGGKYGIWKSRYYNCTKDTWLDK